MAQAQAYTQRRGLSRRSVSDAGSFLAFQSAMVGTATLVVAFRLYIRCFRKKTAGLDDLTIAIATGLSIFGAVCGGFFVHYGFGQHITTLDSNQVENTVKWVIIAVLESYTSLFFVRLSIGIFILRLLHNVRLLLRIAVWAAMALNLVTTIMVTCVWALWCRPMQGIWDHKIKATCLPGSVLQDTNRAFAVISAAIDILYASLPVAILWNLEMDSKTRRNISVIMLFTLITCICAVGKAVSVDETSPDFTYANVAATYWATAEDNLGIIVASLPALRQFFIVTRDDITTYWKKSSQTHMVDGTQSESSKTRSGSMRPSEMSIDSWKVGFSGSTHKTIVPDGCELGDWPVSAESANQLHSTKPAVAIVGV